jgi:hypothetical protein
MTITSSVLKGVSMRSWLTAALVGAALSTGGGVLAGPASASGAAGPAVFVQTDNPSGNAVVAYSRGPGGALHRTATYSTHGLGGILNGSVVDHTASQGSVRYDGAHGLLYVTNAGSDSITVFRVRGADLHRTQVIKSGGTFPVSIARYGNAVFVLNARNGGSIQGFVRVGDFLVRVPRWHRELGLNPNATPEFTTTPGQVAFTADGSKLLVTTKANTSAVDVFSLSRSGTLSRGPVVDALPGAVPFAMAFDRNGHLLLAEAGTNALATFAVRPDGTLRSIATALTGQAATCWIVRVGHDVYLSNAGSANLSGYRLTSAATVAADLGQTATDPGTVDAAASSDHGFLYVQTGAAGIVDEFTIAPNGQLNRLGAVTVPNGVGGEGIAAT